MKKHIKNLLNTIVIMACSSDPLDIAGYFGLKVMLFPFEVLRGFILTVSGQTLIAVNSNLVKQEQKAVLAHELGHYLLSPRGFGYFYIISSTNLDIKIEHEANLFAVGLLTYGQKPEINESLESYAKRLGVPDDLKQYLSIQDYSWGCRNGRPYRSTRETLCKDYCVSGQKSKNGKAIAALPGNDPR